MAIYDELGISRIINGEATLTRLGGSRLAPGVARAMEEGGGAFVDLIQLQRAVGAEIARLTGNEACYVSSGAAAGLTLLTAACITGQDPELRARLPFTDGLKNEVAVHAHTRVGYDFAIRMAGVRLVEFGSRSGTTSADLEAVLTPRTAAVFYFPRGEEERGELPLEAAVELCRPRKIPVLVDAAAQLPPRSNLWDFTKRGADAVVFSGGKEIRGPQSSGLVLGKRELIEGCLFHGPPFPFIGRAMKVGKEELCGILAAVRWYMAHDEDAEIAEYERQVAAVLGAFDGHPRLTARRSWPNEAGQPFPRAELTFSDDPAGVRRDGVLRELMAGDPPISLGPAGVSGIFVNPHTLADGEVELVIDRLKQLSR